MSSFVSLHLLLVTAFLGVLAGAVLTDLESRRIPNRLCLALVGLYPAFVLADGGSADWMGSLAVAVAVLATGMVAFRAGWVGGGDVKLIAATALWIGPASALDFLLTTGLFGGALAILMLSPHRFALARVADLGGCPDLRDAVLGQTIPYGVAIAAAGWLIGAPALLASGG